MGCLSICICVCVSVCVFFLDNKRAPCRLVCVTSNKRNQEDGPPLSSHPSYCLCKQIHRATPHSTSHRQCRASGKQRRMDGRVPIVVVTKSKESSGVVHLGLHHVSSRSLLVCFVRLGPCTSSTAAETSTEASTKTKPKPALEISTLQCIACLHVPLF